MKLSDMTKEQLTAHCAWLEKGQHRTAKAGHLYLSSLFAGHLVLATLMLAARG